MSSIFLYMAYLAYMNIHAIYFYDILIWNIFFCASQPKATFLEKQNKWGTLRMIRNHMTQEEFADI